MTHFITPEQLAEMCARYEAGATIEELSLDFHIYPAGVRRALADNGVTIRPKGDRKGKPHRHSEPKPEPTSAYGELPIIPTDRRGRRRRGKYR